MQKIASMYHIALDYFTIDSQLNQKCHDQEHYWNVKHYVIAVALDWLILIVIVFFHVLADDPCKNVCFLQMLPDVLHCTMQNS